MRYILLLLSNFKISKFCLQNMLQDDKDPGIRIQLNFNKT